jgi:hypothetical protein
MEDWQNPPKGEFWKTVFKVIWGFTREALMNLGLVVSFIFWFIFGLIIFFCTLLCAFLLMEKSKPRKHTLMDVHSGVCGARWSCQNVNTSVCHAMQEGRKTFTCEYYERNKTNE